MEWYKLGIDDTLEQLQLGMKGLNLGERANRREKDGANALTKTKEISKLLKFLKHFNDLLIYGLIVSAILKGISGDFIDITIILLVVVINAVIGYVQEANATDSLKSSDAMISSEAVIVMDGEKETVDAESLVKSDIVFLNPRDIIPADLRILEAYNLGVDEAILTGESTPVDKNSQSLEGEADLGDRINMVYSGTLVNSGSTERANCRNDRGWSQ